MAKSISCCRFISVDLRYWRCPTHCSSFATTLLMGSPFSSSFSSSLNAIRSHCILYLKNAYLVLDCYTVVFSNVNSTNP